MKAKNQHKKIVYAVLLIVFLILIIAKKKYESGKETQQAKSTPTPSINTLAEVKHQYLTLFDNYFENATVTAAFIEYNINGGRNALLIRRDSLISNIDNFNTEVINIFNTDLTGTSREIFLQFEKNLNLPALQKNKQRLGIIRNPGLKIYLKLSNSHIHILYVTRDNFNTNEVIELCEPILEIFSQIHNTPILLEDILPEKRTEQ